MSEVEPFEEREDRERGEALRRRRQARGLAAPVGNAKRFHPCGLVPSQIVGRQWTAGSGRAQRDPLAQPPAIERIGASPGELLERRREVRLHEALACQERRVVDAPERGPQLGRRGDAEQVVGIGRLAPLAGGRRKAVAGARDRVFEEGGPVDR